MNEHEIETLHQQASSFYLQGDVDSAMATWRELLAVDPDDERAKEGVELCERMSGAETASVVTAGQSPFAVGEPAGAPEIPIPVGEPVPSEAEVPSPAEAPARLKDTLDELLDLGETSETPSPPPEPAAAADDDGGGLFDLSDLREEAAEPEPEAFGDDPVPAPSPLPGGAAMWQFGEGPPETPEPPPPEPQQTVPPEPALPPPRPEEAPPPPAEAAAAGLHRRVSDLLSAALAEMERGDKAEALRTLERLLILDEHNSAARSLRAKIREELYAAPPVDEVGAGPEEPANLEDDLEALDLEDEIEPPPALPVVDAPAPPQEDASAVDEGADEPEVAVETGRKRFSLPSLPSPTIWAPVLAVLLLGGGYVGWSYFFAGDDEAPPEVRSTAQPVAAATPAPQGGETTAADPVGDGTTQTPGPSASERLEQSMQRAEASLAAGDYAGALVAFNAALEIDPGNDSILRSLERTAESYRIQREKQARWQQAVQDFDHGNYTAALAYFYRLPEEEQTADLDRYKRNGWYNLGVTALKARDYDRAMSHLGEAQLIGPGDSGIVAAVELARRGTSEPGSRLMLAIERLEFRGLEDGP